MDFGQLRMFKAVVESGSMLKAAAKVHCVPSNITARIKQLEQELNVELFYRHNKRVRLTPAGEIFYGYSCQLLSLLTQAKLELDPNSAALASLKVVAIESSATARLPNVLAQLHQQYPQIQLQFSTDHWQNALKQLSQYQVDAAIVAAEWDDPHLTRRFLYQEAVGIVAASSWGEIRQPQDLIGKAILLWPEGCPYRHAFETWLGQQHISLAISDLASYAAIMGCVSAGAGASLVPEQFYKQYQHIPSIRYYPLPELPAVKHYVYWHQGLSQHWARDLFLQLLEDYAFEAL
jgi:DNA-binding transcriptional LysR family regulator